jgi:hypothetical protein
MIPSELIIGRISRSSWVRGRWLLRGVRFGDGCRDGGFSFFFSQVALVAFLFFSTFKCMIPSMGDLYLWFTSYLCVFQSLLIFSAHHPEARLCTTCKHQGISLHRYRSLRSLKHAMVQVSNICAEASPYRSTQFPTSCFDITTQRHFYRERKETDQVDEQI